MPVARVDGLSIAYEVIGDAGQPWVITPGGRFSKDYPGVREMAQALAEHGRQVVIWDRPNCGASDICVTGASESDVQADALAGLLRQLGLAPAVVIGGSGGSRVSLLAGARHPEVASGLAVWWISGGPFGLMSLGVHYCGNSIATAWQKGMEAVVDLPEWQEVIERNPGNRQRLLEQDPREFIATLERWMLVYYPRPDEVVPGLAKSAAGGIAVPTLVFRSGTTDVHHTRATSEAVAAAVPTAQLVEPPWGDNEWNERGASGDSLFIRWPLLVPQLLEWADRAVPG
ncbi:MAG TPA: alpha/beta hydrolase [Acidimicrobiales bacterium]|nr:alpha/beta hydrolase [Acidimicrobiales bacterium]